MSPTIAGCEAIDSGTSYCPAHGGPYYSDDSVDDDSAGYGEPRGTWDGMDSGEWDELRYGTHSGITSTSDGGSDSSDSLTGTTTNGAGRNIGAADGHRHRPQRAAARQQPRIRSAAMQQPRIITMQDLNF